MNEGQDSLLQGAEVVTFAEAGAASASPQETAAAAPQRALTATVVAVGPHERLTEAAEALRQVGEHTGVRAILISHGSNPSPPVQVAGNSIALVGLKPEYVDNAVAALRLSSLPTLVWWRGGESRMLDRLVDLAERIVLDEEAPEAGWQRALGLLDRAAFSDMRWARLTRWRALMAHFFDLPAVREAAPSFASLRILGADRAAAGLLAAWLRTSLGWQDAARIDVQDSATGAPLESVHLSDDVLELTLRLARSRRCVESSAMLKGRPTVSRIVALGDQRPEALLAEELRVRARDAAFERALRAYAG